MNCSQVEERMIDYAAGKLAGAERASLAEHWAQCPGCRGRAEGFSLVSRVLDDWDTPEISSSFNRRLRQRIAAEEALGWNWERVIGWLRRPATAAAFAAMLLMGSITVWQSRPAPVLAPSPEEVARLHPTDEIMTVVDDFDMLASFDVITEMKDQHQKSKI